LGLDVCREGQDPRLTSPGHAIDLAVGQWCCQTRPLEDRGQHGVQQGQRWIVAGTESCPCHPWFTVGVILGSLRRLAVSAEMPIMRPTADRDRTRDHGCVGHNSRGQRRIVAVTAYDKAAVDLAWRHHWPRLWPMAWPDEANGGSWAAKDYGRVGHDSLSASYLAPRSDGSPGKAIGLVAGQWRGQTRPTADCGRHSIRRGQRRIVLIIGCNFGCQGQ
jgi:hypothetical protein